MLSELQRLLHSSSPCLIFANGVCSLADLILTFAGKDDIGEAERALFARYIQSYETVNIILALLAGIDIGMLTFNEYHSPPFSSLIVISQAFLISSASSVTISLMIATMLSFRFKDLEYVVHLSSVDVERVRNLKSRRGISIAHAQLNAEGQPTAFFQQEVSGSELFHVQMPVVFLEWSILSFLIGILLWYGSLEGKSSVAFGVISAQVGLLWIYYCFIRWKQRNSTEVDKLFWSKGHERGNLDKELERGSERGQREEN